MARSPHNSFPAIALPETFDSERAKGEQVREVLEAMVRERPATALVAGHLQLEEGAPIIALNRVRTADGVPIAVEHTHLPAARFPGLADLVGDDLSLYAILAEHWGVEVANASHRVSVIALEDTDAALLDVPEGLPSFLLGRAAYDASGGAIEWGRSRYSGDRYGVVFDVRPT